jgi:hypothetical protein
MSGPASTTPRRAWTRSAACCAAAKAPARTSQVWRRLAAGWPALAAACGGLARAWRRLAAGWPAPGGGLRRAGPRWRLAAGWPAPGGGSQLAPRQRREIRRPSGPANPVRHAPRHVIVHSPGRIRVLGKLRGAMVHRIFPGARNFHDLLKPAGSGGRMCLMCCAGGHGGVASETPNRGKPVCRSRRLGGRLVGEILGEPDGA